MRSNVFSQAHPAVLFLYFAGVLGLTMSSLHPVLVAISFAAGSVTLLSLKGAAALFKRLPGYLIMLLVLTAANALLSGMGLSVLFYAGGTPVTKEAALYGLCSGGMLVSVIVWFSCYQEMMTGGKFLILFGRIAPTLSMMVSMIFRYIPETLRKGREIDTAQRALIGNETLSRRRKTASGIRLASVLMSWSMENSIETAQSMRARGYAGGRPRSRYTHERFTRYDGALCGILLCLLAALGVLLQSPDSRFAFYPVLTPAALSPWTVLFYSVYLLCPLVLEGRERLLCLRLN